MERWKISQKIFFAIMAISLILIMLITVCFSYIYVTNNISEILSDKKNESVILSNSVDNWIEKNETLMLQLFYDKELASICSNSVNDSLYFLKMDEYLRDFYAANDGMFAISFTDNSGRKSVISNLEYNSMNGIVTHYYDEAKERVNENVWDIVKTSEGNKLVLARQIWQLNPYMKKISYGVVMFMIDEEEIYDLYSDTVPVYRSRTYVVNNDNKILSATDRSASGSTFDDIYTTDGDMLTDRDGSVYYLISSGIGRSGMHIVTAVPRSEVMSVLYDTAKSMWLIIAVLLVTALIAAVFIAHTIEVPINMLADNLDDIIKNNFSAKLHVKTDKTTRHLMDSYNKMLDRLNDLVNQNLNMELRNKEAQLQAYEMQINPHFIYNTLDMIRMMAVMDDPENIDEAVICLSSLLRFNNRIEKEVLIEDEIENIEYYFRILKLRYGDDFDYEIDVPEEVRQCYTLKFLLQPIAENAVKHGLEKSERSGYIKVMARELNDEIILFVKDNGAGLSEYKLKSLRESIFSSDVFQMRGKNIGIVNVYHRIRLFYGEGFGLDIDSTENEKTVVSLHIPVRKSKE